MKNSVGTYLASKFLWIKRASSSLIILQKAKLSTRSVTHICWCIWRTFEGKTHREVTQGVLILHVNVPARRALEIQKKLAYLGFQYLDNLPYSPDLAPSDYHLFPGLKKRLIAIFLPTHSSLQPLGLGWRNKISGSLSSLQKLEQNAKKWVVRWTNPEFVRCRLFPFLSGYWLISTPHLLTFLGKCVELYVILNCVLLSFFPVWFKVKPSNSRGDMISYVSASPLCSVFKLERKLI